MRRRTLIAVIATVAIAVLLAAALRLPDFLKREEARRSVAAYNTALTRALYEVNPEFLADYAHEREMGRVTSYFAELAGRGVFMEADMLSLELEEVTSEGTTVTVTTRERWTYVERDSASAQQIGTPVEEEEAVVYLLVPRDGRLIVYLSELREEEQ